MLHQKKIRAREDAEGKIIRENHNRLQEEVWDKVNDLG
jgi:hypothetical protein